jgi:hypothetical protein
VIGLTLAVVGCGDGTEATDRWRGPITGGTDSGPEDDAVVRLLTPTYGCSGALVAPNLLVTTAHCVALGGSYIDFSCSPEGELDNGGSGAGEIGDHQVPELIAIHTGLVPTADPAAYGRLILSSGTTVICRNDLAFLVLDRNLDGLPILPLSLDAPVLSGERISVIGYGVSTPDQVEPRRQRRSGLFVDEIDRPPRTFTTGIGPCAGDSGGPALSDDTGAVLGVFSVLQGSCGSELSNSVYTQVVPFRDLALLAFEAAGAEPLLAEPVEPRSGDAAGASTGCSLAASPGATSGWLALCCSIGLLGFRRRTARLRSGS